VNHDGRVELNSHDRERSFSADGCRLRLSYFAALGSLIVLVMPVFEGYRPPVCGSSCCPRC
jgi:hypothetical protein